MKIVETITNVIDWFEKLFHKEYGVRVLYILILLIPSISLYVLYSKAVDRAEKIEARYEAEHLKYTACLENKSELRAILREEVRKEIFEESSSIFNLLNEFQLEVLLENSKTLEKIRDLEKKLDK